MALAGQLSLKSVPVCCSPPFQDGGNTSSEGSNETE